MSYFGHQTLLFEILDLGRMVTNILSGLNMHATETIVYGYLGLINKECDFCYCCFNCCCYCCYSYCSSCFCCCYYCITAKMHLYVIPVLLFFSFLIAFMHFFSFRSTYQKGFAFWCHRDHSSCYLFSQTETVDINPYKLHTTYYPRVKSLQGNLRPRP